MALKFCPECGSMMVPDKGESGVSWECRKCGHTIEDKKNKKVALKSKVKRRKGIPVLDNEINKEKLSIVDEECPKCGKVGALWWIQQTRSGDEPSTRFFKCVDCSHTWREYA